MQVLLIQVDGKLPNLALMKLSHWHRSQGHTVTLTKRRPRDLFDPSYDKVYASAIFSDSKKFFATIKSDWPNVIFGGTGTTNPLTVESIIGTDYEFTIINTIRISRNLLASQNADAALAANSVSYRKKKVSLTS